MPPARKRPTHTSDEESDLFGSADCEECPVCHQEFADGVCPIASADCPYREDDDGDEDEDDEEDFEDVKHLRQVLKDDKEADRLIEEAEDFEGEEDDKER